MQLHSGKLLHNACLVLAITSAVTTANAEALSKDMLEVHQETRILTFYALSPYLRANHIQVVVEAGQATLSGSVEAEVNKELAQQIALGVEGISKVDNQLVVAKPAAGLSVKLSDPEQQAIQKIADSWLTIKVKSTYLYSRHVHGGDITVTTTAGIVTLTGKLASGAERALAIELAQNIRGVKGVDAANLVF